MKPSIRTIDYVVLVQSAVIELDEVPSDIQEEVTKWLSFFVTGKLETANENDKEEVNEDE